MENWRKLSQNLIMSSNTPPEQILSNSVFLILHENICCGFLLQLTTYEDTLHKMSNLIFYKNSELFFRMSFAEIFTQQAKHQ